jgi:hypothetical protein
MMGPPVMFMSLVAWHTQGHQGMTVKERRTALQGTCGVSTSGPRLGETANQNDFIASQMLRVLLQSLDPHQELKVAMEMVIVMGMGRRHRHPRVSVGQHDWANLIADPVISCVHQVLL